MSVSKSQYARVLTQAGVPSWYAAVTADAYQPVLYEMGEGDYVNMLTESDWAKFSKTTAASETWFPAQGGKENGLGMPCDEVIDLSIATRDIFRIPALSVTNPYYDTPEGCRDQMAAEHSAGYTQQPVVRTPTSWYNNFVPSKTPLPPVSLAQGNYAASWQISRGKWSGVPDASDSTYSTSAGGFQQPSCSPTTGTPTTCRCPEVLPDQNVVEPNKFAGKGTTTPTPATDQCICKCQSLVQLAGGPSTGIGTLCANACAGSYGAVTSKSGAKSDPSTQWCVQGTKCAQLSTIGGGNLTTCPANGVAPAGLAFATEDQCKSVLAQAGGSSGAQNQCSHKQQKKSYLYDGNDCIKHVSTGGSCNTGDDTPCYCSICDCCNAHPDVKACQGVVCPSVSAPLPVAVIVALVLAALLGVGAAFFFVLRRRGPRSGAAGPKGALQ